jgi:hypothetical protein
MHQNFFEYKFLESVPHIEIASPISEDSNMQYQTILIRHYLAWDEASTIYAPILPKLTDIEDDLLYIPQSRKSTAAQSGQ